MQLDKYILEDLIKEINISEMKSNFFIYSMNSILQKEEDVLLVEDDEYDVPDEIDGYEHRMSWQTAKGVIENLQSQNPTPTLDDYIEAINYYIENDAFIDVENRENKHQGGFKIWG